MYMDCSNFADRLANQFDYLYKEKYVEFQNEGPKTCNNNEWSYTPYE